MQATSLEKRYKVLIIILSLCIQLVFIMPLIILQSDSSHEAMYIIFHNQHEEETAQTQQNQLLQEEIIEYILSSGMIPNKTNELFQTDQYDTQAQEQSVHVDDIAKIPEDALTSISDEQDTLPETAIDITAPDNTTMLVTDNTQQTEQKAEPITKTKPQQSPKNIQKTVSLGQLAQGFLKSMQQEEGINNPPQMDVDRLAAHQYATKIWNIIKNSFRADHNALHLSQSVDTMAYLVITIAKSGKLIDIHLESNTINHGFKQIESLIVTHAQKAGLFPPLPSRFAVAQKTFTFPIRIQEQEGYHTYHLSYGPQQ